MPVYSIGDLFDVQIQFCVVRFPAVEIPSKLFGAASVFPMHINCSESRDLYSLSDFLFLVQPRHEFMHNVQ